MTCETCKGWRFSESDGKTNSKTTLGKIFGFEISFKSFMFLVSRLVWDYAIPTTYLKPCI
ncbi:hypothetical protein HanIR_Chr01g0003981 [Helianthus annuus]|nr:hypothetical protein HanIR_Chr01g0003981 [Helianthus annuus]